MDNIREINENIKHPPAASIYKIIIIDEVHMISVNVQPRRRARAPWPRSRRSIISSGCSSRGWGRSICPDCQVPVEAQTRDELGRRLRRELRQRGDLLLLAPVVRNRKGFHTDVAEWAASHGYAEVRADGKFYPTSERLRLDRFREHDVEIVVGVLDAKQQGKGVA